MGVRYQVCGFIIIALTICAVYRPFSKSLHVSPEGLYTADVHFRRGLDFLSQDSLEEAEKSFREAVDSQPNYALNYYYLAEVFARQEKFQSAVDAYSRALDIDPEFYLAYYSLALLLGNAGKHQDAIVLLRKAIVLNPEYVAAYQELANLYVETGDFKSAEIVYELLERLGRSAQH